MSKFDTLNTLPRNYKFNEGIYHVNITDIDVVAKPENKIKIKFFIHIKELNIHTNFEIAQAYWAYYFPEVLQAANLPQDLPVQEVLNAFKTNQIYIKVDLVYNQGFANYHVVLPGYVRKAITTTAAAPTVAAF